MDNERIDHGPETIPPLVANHGGGDIDNPDAMSRICSNLGGSLSQASPITKDSRYPSTGFRLHSDIR